MAKDESKSRVIGKDRKVARSVLGDEERQMKRAIVGRSYETQREVEETFQAFAKYAAPRVRRTLDPGYENDKLQGEAKLSIEEARALNDDLRGRRKLTGAAVARPEP